jgi:hypothetical protein
MFFENLLSYVIAESELGYADVACNLKFRSSAMFLLLLVDNQGLERSPM